MTAAQPLPPPPEGAHHANAPLKSVSTAAGAARARRPGVQLRWPRFTRRGLQIALGVVWLLDGALQFQPFMLSPGFGQQIISPAGDGQPAFVGAAVHWAARIIAVHPVAWDIPFAFTQMLLGLGMLYPRTAKAALAASLPWVVGVWYLGEGLGGITSGNASLLTGAPGAVLLYGVLALAAWPQDDRRPDVQAARARSLARLLSGRSDVPPARWLALAWAALWALGAILQGLPASNSGTATGSAISHGADAVPGWLGNLDTSVGTWFTHHGGVVYALIAIEALIGLAALFAKTVRFSAAAGIGLAVGIWLVPENFGQISSGQATDPNSAPLIALMGIALVASHAWPIRRAREPRRPEGGRRGKSAAPGDRRDLDRRLRHRDGVRRAPARLHGRAGRGRDRRRNARDAQPRHSTDGTGGSRAGQLVVVGYRASV